VWATPQTEDGPVPPAIELGLFKAPPGTVILAASPREFPDLSAGFCVVGRSYTFSTARNQPLVAQVTEQVYGVLRGTDPPVRHGW
jgi:hypothetical protein